MAGCVATIGFFDGVHRGHQFVIGCVAEEAHRRGLEAVVVTFDRHPREVVGGGRSNPNDRNDPNDQSNRNNRNHLTSLAEKRRLILQAGADRCEVLHFDEQLAALPARSFMQSVLRQQLGVEVLLLGYDNRFGHREKGVAEDFDDYVAYGAELGIEVCRLPEYEAAVRISSSTIRNALRQGFVTLAESLLGRPYRITGRVAHGYEEGRKLGFPTANLSPDSICQLVPAPGVYAVRVSIVGTSPTDDNHSEQGLPGMMNIGTRPTYGGHALSLEVHLFDFCADLYDQLLTVSFVDRIRSEQAFASPEALRQQLEQDRQTAQQLLL